MRILIHVQHLLGVGHLQRMLQLAAGLARSDFLVDVVSGGMPAGLPLPAGINFHQLPALRSATTNFDRLLDEQDNQIDDAWRERRRGHLLELFESIAPNALLTETFPFGRRMLRFEMLPLLEVARAHPSCRLIVASIRDILQPKAKAGRNAEIVSLVKRYYDHVLVHGDATLAPLAHSFAMADAIADRISYSGYVCQTAAAQASDAADEVLVSAGGSATGLRLLQNALAARPLCSLATHRWRLRVSPSIDARDFDALRADATDGVIVERNQNDFRARLDQARLSISQAGYNTVTDILSSSTLAVLVPFAEAGEVEQSLRARLLHDRGRVLALDQSRLDPPSLARAIDRASNLDTRLQVDLDGVRNSARLLRDWLDGTAANP